MVFHINTDSMRLEKMLSFMRKIRGCPMEEIKKERKEKKNPVGRNTMRRTLERRGRKGD